MTAGFTARVPCERLRVLNDAPVRANADYVLYWMIASRRPSYNFALEHAAYLAQDLGVGLLVFEALRADYPWACPRFHVFVQEGMRDNARAFAKTSAIYYPYVEPKPGAGHGLLEALAKRAAAVVTDDFPGFFLPHMTAAVAKRLPIACHSVDSCGIYPMRATDRVFTTAASFRRHLQRELASRLLELPRKQPLARRRLSTFAVSAGILRRYPPATLDGNWLVPASGPATVVERPGGQSAARARLRRFVEHGLEGYAQQRNVIDDSAQSGLSPYLHFGHISSHEILHAVLEHDGWSPDRLADRATGSRRGYWGAAEGVEAFLDQLVTWRELSYNGAVHLRDFESYDSLPDWARLTLRKHQKDRRAYRYDLGELDTARTHDALWNAAQNQLRQDGIIHNYLRMLWGKKILEWTPSPQRAFEIMVELNNRYALDGRDPNSYAGIGWVLGRYDRAWGPERPIFGKIRYMSSTNTARKMNVSSYVARYGFR